MLELTFSLPKGAGDIKRIGRVAGAARGLLVAEACQKHKALTLVITNNSDEAERLQNELAFFMGSNELILSFPDWETLPYDVFSPHQDIISQRIATLNRLPSMKQGVLIVPASTLMHRLAPPSFLAGNSLILDEGQTLDPMRLRQQLTDAGYRAVDTVFEHGEFAMRGSIIDIYPMGSGTPFRIELFDDEVETLRTFDAETQRSIDTIKQIRLLPAKEFPFDEAAIKGFKQRWRETFDVDYRACPIYQDISNGLTPPGIEYYQPLFFDETHTLFDYLPDDAQIIVDPELEQASKLFWEDTQARYEQRRYDITHPLLSPDTLFLSADQLFGALKNYGRLQLNTEALEKKAGRENLDCITPPELPVDAQASQPLKALEAFLLERDGPILFCAESAGRREALLELLGRINLKPTVLEGWQAFLDSNTEIGITTFPLERGLSLPGAAHLITETQLFGRQVFQRRRRSREKEQADQVIKNLSELSIGAPVVHIDHGVGRYQGLQTIELEGQANEFLTLEYLNNAKLYVPVSALHLISRYTGASDEFAPLHKLGAEQWSKAKQKAAEKARDAAAELLDIYARRAARKGFSFADPDQEYASLRPPSRLRKPRTRPTPSKQSFAT